jgi:hypothetical protein
MWTMNRSGSPSLPPGIDTIAGGETADARTIVDGPLKEFISHGGKGPIQRLREGSFDLERLKCVMLSHQHFDRKSPYDLPT